MQAYTGSYHAKRRRMRGGGSLTSLTAEFPIDPAVASNELLPAVMRQHVIFSSLVTSSAKA